MIDDKINYLWSAGKTFDARAFTALRPWLMRGLPTLEEIDRGREAASEKDGGGSKAESGRSGGEGGDRTSGGKSGIAAARELFRWRDDATEAAETKRTGVGLLFWCSLNDNVEAVLELAKEAAANTSRGGRNEPNNALRITRPDLFGIFVKGATALHAAASLASWPVVEALLEMGASPAARASGNGTDPLMCMAMFGRADNITRWCKRYPTWDFSRRDRTVGATTVGYALTFGPNKLETVKALVKAGANPLEITALTGTTCLHNAAANKDADAELVRYLLKLPGVKALVDQPQRCQTFKWKAKLLAVRLAVKLGSKKTVLLNVYEWSKLTPLITAARNGNAAVMKVLVEEGGADIQPRNARGHTALDLLAGGSNALEETTVLLGGVVSRGVGSRRTTGSGSLSGRKSYVL